MTTTHDEAVNQYTYIRALCMRPCGWRGVMPRGPLDQCPRCPRCGDLTERMGTTTLRALAERPEDPAMRPLLPRRGDAA